MSTRLRDLDDDLGAAFRSADRDAPRPEAKAALMAALGVGAATLATASAATATAGGAASGAATTAAAGGSTAAAAKGAGMAAVLKWVVASAVVVSGGAATVHAVSSPDPSRGVTPAYVAPFQNAPTARPTPARNAEAVATIAPSEEPPPPTRAQPLLVPTAPMAPITPSAEVAEVAGDTPLAPAHLASAPSGVTNGGTPAQPASPRLSPDPAVGRGAARADNERAGRPTVGDEIAHLDRARSLLAQGRGAEALEAINSYRRTFPAGVLAEEAAVLEVESLASAGQHDRARSFGARFVTGHPRSPLVPRVVRAIGRGREGQDPAP